MASMNGKCWVIHSEKGVKPTLFNKLQPLLFPPVLNKIFGYLSAWNHKKCRLVCKSWEVELRPFLRLNCKVNLTKLVTAVAEKEMQFANEIQPNFFTILAGIAEICSSFVVEEDPIIIRILMQQAQLPLQIKYLEIKNFTWNFIHVTKILRELPLLEELRLPILCSTENLENLDTCLNAKENVRTNARANVHSSHTNKYISKSTSTNNWRRNDFLKDSSYQITEEFHKLKKIIVTPTIRDLQYYDYKCASVTPILNLIHLTPNLEEIYYPNIVQFTSSVDNPARVLLENLINCQQWKKLSILKIDTFLSNTDLFILSAQRLQFSSLQLTLTPEIHCRNLYDFLTISEPTLKSLTLTFRDGFQLSRKFPCLSELGQMTIILWNGHLDYIQDILKLKVLLVVLMEMEDDIFNKLKYHNFKAHSKIEELEVHANANYKAGTARALLTMMPQTLRSLTLDCVNDSLLDFIYRKLPQLQELGILYGGFSESGITGIYSDDYCDKEIYGTKRRFGISDLKKLKCLVLTGDLTDGQLILGVAKCQSLQRLELNAKSSSKVTDISIKNIADELSKSLDYLRLMNFSVLVSDEMVSYLRSKFNGREVHLG